MALKLVWMIFDYWWHWVSLPDTDPHEDIGLEEGATYYDGYNATFWYLLNVEWYRMNNRQFAYTGCKDPFYGLRDFDTDYVEANYRFPWD